MGDSQGLPAFLEKLPISNLRLHWSLTCFSLYHLLPEQGGDISELNDRVKDGEQSLLLCRSLVKSL